MLDHSDANNIISRSKNYFLRDLSQILFLTPKGYKWKDKLTASSPEIARSFSVPVAIKPPSSPSEFLFPLLPVPLVLTLYLCVGRALMDSSVAPLTPCIFSRTPRIEIIQGRQQHIIAHKMKGIAYPMQLMVRKAIHNLQSMDLMLVSVIPVWERKNK